MRQARRVFAMAMLLGLCAAPAPAQTLRIGIQSDPTTLDPARSGAFIERIVFASLCDKLIDIGPDLSLRPELATGWSWSEDALSLTLTLRDGVRFQDGTPFDAEAAKLNLERYRNARESRRRAELAPIAAIETPSPRELVLRLSSPFVPLPSVLADRAGMMLSPKAIAERGEKLSDDPICAGAFRIRQRVTQDRVEVERFDDYWNRAAIKLERVIFRPIPDNTVRLLNLRAGQLDLIERIAPSDVAATKADPRLRVADATTIAFDLIQFNINHGAGAASPIARDARLREAFELSVDRQVINQVVMEGLFVPSNQPEPPGSTFHHADLPIPPRDVARARALLAASGQPSPEVVLRVANSPSSVQVAEVIQAMTAEAGFRVKIEATEAAAMVAAQERGDFEAAIGIWSGRPDPDGNTSIWLACNGFLNRAKWCAPEIDAALAQGRSLTDPALRKPHYRDAWARMTEDRPYMVLYHHRWFYAFSPKLTGFAPAPDGLIRFAGLALAN